MLALFGHLHLSLTKLREQAFEKQFAKKALQTELTIHHPDNIEPSYEVVLKELKEKK